MHVYQYYYKKKKINTGLLCFVIGIASVILFFYEKKDIFPRLKTEAAVVCYEEILELYLPGFVYDEKEQKEKTILDGVLAHLFPLGEEVMLLEEYQTQVESEFSYEAILAREAADENYIDENGRIVETGNGPKDYGVMEDAASVTVQEDASTDAVVKETAQESIRENGNDGSVSSTGSILEQADAASAGRNSAAEKQISYSREKLSDFDYLIQNFYQIDNTTTIGREQLNVDALLDRDMRLSHDASTPQILIYHTHSQEAYADSTPGEVSDTVVGVGDYLAQILTEQYGFHVIHHKGEYDVNDRDHAYSNAGPALEKILAENPQIEVVIDLHRDGVREDTRLVTDMNGTQMAQIMFFNGLSRTTSTGDIEYLYNPYIKDNLALSFQMQLKTMEYYPGFARRIYLKGYRYNMHYCPKTLLIEVGAQTNTVQEAMNAMVPLADILHKVLTGAQ